MATLQIIVKNGDIQGGGGEVKPNDTPNAPQTPVPVPDSKDKTNDKSNRAWLGVAGMLATQALSYTTSNVGKWSGDSRLQAKVDMGLQAVNIGVAFAVNPVLGIASLATTIATNVMDENWRNTEEQLRLKGQRARNGYTDTKSIFTSRRH